MTSTVTAASLTAGARSRSALGRLSPRVVYVACWLLVGLYQGLNAAIGEGSDVATWKPFVWEFSSALIVMLLVPLVFRFEQSFRIDSRPRSRIVLAHLGGVLVFSSVHTAVMISLRQL